MTNYKTSDLKTQIETLRQERADLDKRIPQVEGEVAALESRVEKGRSRAQQQHGNTDPDAMRELVRVRGVLKTLESSRQEINRELAKLQAQADAGGVKARCAAEVAELDAQIAAQQAEADAHTIKAAELESPRAAAAVVAKAAKDAEAAALVAGEPTDGGAREQTHRADVLARAVTQAQAMVSAAQAEITALRARRQQLQGEADVASCTARRPSGKPSRGMSSCPGSLGCSARNARRTAMPR